MVKKQLISVFMISASFLLGGCWDYGELDKEAAVTSLAYDLDKSKNPVVTAEVKHSASSVFRGQETGETSTSREIIEGRGSSSFEAIQNMTHVLPLHLNFSHHMASVFSQSFACSIDFVNGWDRITRMGLTRRRGLVFVTSGTAKTILDAKVSMEADVGSTLVGLAREAKNQQFSMKEDLNDLLYDYDLPGIEPLAPRIEINHTTNGRNIIEAKGAGAFQGLQLVGWLNGMDTRGVLWIRNQSGNPTFNLKWSHNEMTFRTQAITGKIIPLTTPGKPQFIVDIKWKGAIAMNRMNHAIELQDLAKLQKQVEQYIVHTINHSIATAKSLHTDVFGFGNALYRQNPNQFRKQAANWNQVGFPNAEIRVIAKAQIENNGLTNEPPTNDADLKGKQS